MAIKRILVPIDFSKDSLDALTYATQFAASFGADVTLLHVVEPIYYAAPTDIYTANANIAALLEQQRRVAETQLGRIASSLEKKGQRVRAAIKTGAASKVIVDSAKKERADLIIMATHGRTGLAHMFMGSVAEKVVRSAACPVLTVRGGKRSPKTR
ncbi:MAG: uspa protein [Deltaproteobacteria bacterium]|jgi:nucleotide-binding universal stress UspA family protein|nr:uspa protein [Deltaproteobacteria bacterium]